MSILFSRHNAVLLLLGAIFVIFHAWAFMTRPDSTVHLYDAVPWADIPAHIIFGAWLALLLLYPALFRHSGNPMVIFGLVMLAGIGWELFEHGFDVLYGLPHGYAVANHGAADTVKDIFDNGLGAGAALFFFHKRENAESGPV